MRCLLPMCAFLSLGFAPAPFLQPARVTGDLKALQGTWKVVRCQAGAVTVASEGLTVTVQGNRLTLLADGTENSRFTLAPNQTKSPKELNLRDATVYMRRPVVKLELRSVYWLEGDTFTFHFGTPSRPNQYQFICKRTKR
jgi:uncharacterized protein (TIGR03067 family)